MKLVLICMIALLGATRAYADSNCLSQDRANQILKDYVFESWSDSGKRWIRQTAFDLCSEKSLPTTIAKAITFLQDLPPLATANPEFDYNTLGVPYDFFKKRIQTIQFETNKHSEVCAHQGIVAFVYTGHIMHVCPYAIDFPEPADMAAVIVHEARHVEGFPHVACAHGPYKKIDATVNPYGSCDSSYQEKGSYGVGAELKVKIANSPQMNPVLRQGERALVVEDFVERFNHMPFGLKANAILQTADGRILADDGKSSSALVDGVVDDDVMTVRAGQPTFYDPIAASVKSYAFHDDFADTQGSFAKLFREQLSQEERTSLIDVSYGDSVGCMLFTHSIRCGVNLPDHVLTFEKIVPKELIYVAQSSIVKNGVLYVHAQDGYLYAVPSVSDAKSSFKESDFVRSRKPYSFSSLVTVGRSEWALMNGAVTAYSRKTHSFEPVPRFEGMAFKKMVGPIFWSKDLENL